MKTDAVAIPVYLRGRELRAPAILDRHVARTLGVYGSHARNGLSYMDRYPALNGAPLHRIVLGLQKFERGVVHHLNGVRMNCTLANLWVCADNREHGRFWHLGRLPNMATYLQARSYQESVGFRQPAASAYFDLDAVPPIVLAAERRLLAARYRRVLADIDDELLELDNVLEGVLA